MSDIPEARRILEEALKGTNPQWRVAVKKALMLMTRESADFRVPPGYPKLTPKEAVKARRMRSEGMGVNNIAAQLGTNVGRVSEAIHHKR